MDFFNSLPLDLKMLVVGIAGAALLALFSGNHKSEKRYMVVLALLAAAGVYRFTHIAGDAQRAVSADERSAPRAGAASPRKVPLVSTSAK
jgi:hypothetical protein